MKRVLLWYLFAYLPALPLLVFGYPIIVLMAFLITITISEFISRRYIRVMIVFALFILRMCAFGSLPSEESWYVQGYAFIVLAIGVCLINRKNDHKKVQKKDIDHS